MLDIFKNGYQLHIHGSLDSVDHIIITIRMYPRFSPGGELVSKMTNISNFHEALSSLGEIAKNNPVKIPEQLNLL